MGAGNCVMVCDLGIFADQAAEPIPAQDTRTGHFRGKLPWTTEVPTVAGSPRLVASTAVGTVRR